MTRPPTTKAASQQRAHERLPVVDDPRTLRVVGIVSRSDLLKPMPAQHEEESLRERVFGIRGSKVGPGGSEEN